MIRRPEIAAGEDIFQQRTLVHSQSRKYLRHGKTQMPLPDAEDRRAKARDVYLLAGVNDPRPVDLRSKRIRRDGDICDLAQADPAVEKMLVGMTDQIEQPICRGESTDRNILDPDLL